MRRGLVGVTYWDSRRQGSWTANDRFLEMVGLHARGARQAGEIDWACALTPARVRLSYDEGSHWCGTADGRRSSTTAARRERVNLTQGSGREVPILIAAAMLGNRRGRRRRALALTRPRHSPTRKRAEEALRRAEPREVAQQERNRLARDLHDSVTQALFAATLKAEALTLADESLPDAVLQVAEEVRRLNRGALAQMRTLLLELRGEPLEEVPLDQLLRQLVEAAEGRSSARVRLTVHGDGKSLPTLNAPVYRITQEALNNMTRHARAAKAWVDLEVGPGRSTPGRRRRRPRLRASSPRPHPDGPQVHAGARRGSRRAVRPSPSSEAAR